MKFRGFEYPHVASRLSPARAAAAGAPGHARFPRSAKLASENATKRSPADRSSRARAAAIAVTLIVTPALNSQV
jgi:hypothetical protein